MQHSIIIKSLSIIGSTLVYSMPEEDVGHDHVMYGLIGFQSTVKGEMYGERDSSLSSVSRGASSRIL